MRLARVKPRVKSLVRWVFNRAGFRLVRIPNRGNTVPWDMDQEFAGIFEKTLPYSMTSTANRYALYKAIQYLKKHQIPGDIVECGVWRGGSSMIAALTLLALGDTTRRLWLYDTFEGTTEPGEMDVRVYDEKEAHRIWQQWNRTHADRWLSSPLDEVKANMASTGYPAEHLIYVQGKVEDTIPANMPTQIALLRLDTDWYQSTYHELRHLFPRLSKYGILIIDDYGWWRGSREATDQYVQENNVQIFLNRVDASCRLGQKTH